MWVLVAFFHPALSIACLGTLPMQEIVNNKNTILAAMGYRVAGKWLQYFICIDAVLVMTSSILMAYIGVTGLVKRMALDRCLPQFFLTQNSVKNTNHWIIIVYFVITSALFTAVQGSVTYLTGVFAISFMVVMIMFAFGSIAVGKFLIFFFRKRHQSFPKEKDQEFSTAC